MPTPALLIRDARKAAGLTQAELARRMRTTQSTVARLEGAGANPTVAMLDRALRAADHKLCLEAARGPQEVDETLIAENLRLTPAERLDRFTSFYRGLRKMVVTARRIDADSA